MSDIEEIVEDDPMYYVKKVYHPIALKSGGVREELVKVWKFNDEILETDYLVEDRLKKPFELEGLYWNDKKLDSCHYEIILNRYSLYLRFYRTTVEKIKGILFEKRTKSLTFYLKDKDEEKYMIIFHDKALEMGILPGAYNTPFGISKFPFLSTTCLVESIVFYDDLDFEETLDKKLCLFDLIGWE